jgi:uncharacterized membrane protein
MAMGPEDEAALSDRVARLEAQLDAMRAEIAMLCAGHPAPAAPPLASIHVPLPQSRVDSAAPLNFPPRFPQISNSARSESLESQLGARVLSKVAVVLLLVGAAWFLKWAFDNRWIGPRGRILTGLLAGVAVILWSEHFRRQRLAAFSYALKAVGSGVLYLSLWASFQLYHLVPAPVALIAMIAVTAWNAVMAWSQDAPLLAAYALLGGYLTPLLLSSGGDHEIFLFTYLFAIAGSLAALLRLKPWNHLLLGALPVTTAYFIGWYVQFFDSSKASLTIAFALLLWAVFAAIPLLALDAEGTIAGVLEPLAAALFGALSIYSVLSDSAAQSWQPWCAVAFAAVYLALTRLRKGLVATLHLSLAIVFLTVAIPLKATGHGITLGWLVEAIALLAIATSSSIEARAQSALRWLSCGALLLGTGGALIGPFVLASVQTPFLNREFATALAAVAALIAAIVLANRIPPSTSVLNRESIAASALVLLNVVLLLSMHHEIFRTFTSQQPTFEALAAGREYARFSYSGWMMLQGAAVLTFGFLRREPLPRWIGLVLLAATVLKTFAYDMRSLGTGYRVVSYLALGVVLMAVSYAYQKDWLGLLHTPDESATNSPGAGGNA